MTLLQATNLILLTVATVVLLPIGALCIECLAALWSRRGAKLRLAQQDDANAANAAGRPRVAVLIPAHDEQTTIEQTVRAIFPMLSPADCLVVVADNCTDRTAELAGGADAEVIERTDPDRRGKGYALQHGFRHLAADPPDVVVMIDADCLPGPGAIDRLARLAQLKRRPVQARNLTDRRPAAGPVEAVSIFANRITNLVRPLGLLRLGTPCRMTGTGMAIPWSLVDEAAPAGGELVEDMRWGIDLALRGHLPLFCPEACVSSAMPGTDSAFASQRTRWEHGHLCTAIRQGPRLFLTALLRGRPKLLAMAVDLCIPPLTLLVTVWAALLTVCCAALLFGAWRLPAAMLAGGGLAMVLSLSAVWAVFCRRQVSLRALAVVPLYMLRKQPIYARFLFRRQNAWVRTDRDAPPDGSRADARRKLYFR